MLGMSVEEILPGTGIASVSLYFNLVSQYKLKLIPLSFSKLKSIRLVSVEAKIDSA
jgi:hypothetical protein